MDGSRTNELGQAGATRAPTMALMAGALPQAGPDAAAGTQGDHRTQPLPISLGKPAVPPWVQELSRLLDRRPLARGDFANLRSVESVLRMPGASPWDLPDEVVRAAGLELRWLARQDTPSPALARLLDQFEHQLLQPALRRLQGRGGVSHR